MKRLEEARQHAREANEAASMQQWQHRCALAIPPEARGLWAPVNDAGGNSLAAPVTMGPRSSSSCSNSSSSSCSKDVPDVLMARGPSPREPWKPPTPVRRRSIPSVCEPELFKSGCLKRPQMAPEVASTSALDIPRSKAGGAMAQKHDVKDTSSW